MTEVASGIAFPGISVGWSSNSPVGVMSMGVLKIGKPPNHFE
jgi:hypothetical protein